MSIQIVRVATAAALVLLAGCSNDPLRSDGEATGVTARPVGVESCDRMIAELDACGSTLGGDKGAIYRREARALNTAWNAAPAFSGATQRSAILDEACNLRAGSWAPQAKAAGCTITVRANDTFAPVTAPPLPARTAMPTTTTTSVAE